MGGKVFAQPSAGGHPALHTPRLSPPDYENLKQRYIEFLSNFFDKADAAHDAPNKPDHGDIDILVEGPQKSDLAELTKDLAAQLEAKRYVCSDPISSYAVPLAGSQATFVQLDVHVCRPGYLEWEKFTKSYGDLWQILSMIIRNMGLTATDKGLHVRIPEIEANNRKDSMLFLTHDPATTMAFLGLDAEAFEKGFSTEEEVFGWAVGGRFFDRASLDREREKANDRHRLKTREMYKRFVDEMATGAYPHAGTDCLWTRETVLIEALKTFGREEEYQQRMDDFRAKEKEKAFWKSIGEMIPQEGDKLNLVIRALKRWVEPNGGQPFVLSEARALEETPFWSSHLSELEPESPFQRWVKDNWAVVRDKEKKRTSDLKAGRKAKRLRSENGAASPPQAVPNSEATTQADETPTMNGSLHK